MKEETECLNLVLLGKTGAGKSAAGNTILGRQAFKSEKCGKSVTRDVAVESGTVCGFPVTVYDTPGLFDPELDEQEIRHKYQSVFQKCNSDLCAFFLVIKADRFTEEERKTVEKIEKLLGENRLKKTWILFTRGDELDEEKKTIKDFVNETESLQKLVQRYDQRYHVFNNKKRGHIEQVKLLLTKVLKLCLKTMVKGPTKLKQTDKKLLRPKPTPVSGLPSRRIVLLGKTGVGKSAAGNTILGQREFKSKRKMNSVTHESSMKQTTVSGRSVSVVDTPGFFDTKMKPEVLMMEIAKSVYESSPGPHAFLIVLRADDRFTEHEQQIPQMIEMLFGEGVLKYSIILFTHGDDLEEETIEEVIEESQALRRLVDQCGGRFHVFNNKDQSNRKQVNDLLKKIDTMIEQNGGGHYSNQMFEDAERFRREEEERKQREDDEIKLQEEKQRQEEIDRVKKEAEDKTRAECEAKYERKGAEEVRKEQEEKQRAEVSERVEIETEERVGPELDAQPNTESENNQNAVETSSGFKQFFSKYRKYFYIAIGVGVVIGAISGGALVGVFAGAVIGGGALAGAVIGGVAGGGVVGGGVVGGVAGFAGVVCKVVDKHSAD